MAKKDMSGLIKKYKQVCVQCPMFEQDGVNFKCCVGCEKFGKEEMAELLSFYYQSRHPEADTSRLKMTDDVLDMIFELHFKGVSKYSIVQQVNEKYFKTNKKGQVVGLVNWKKVHWVIEGKGYKGQDAKTRIEASRARVRAKMDAEEKLKKEINWDEY